MSLTLGMPTVCRSCQHDYKVLLHNSTFCLVPRGRRLGSFRYLETLQAGCIPVLLSNGWVLPFAEVIDWSKAAIWGDERLLLQVPSLVRSISHGEILSLRQHTQFLWNAYFSSVEKIVDTTLEVMKERIFRLAARPTFVWNSLPGSLIMLPEYSSDLKRYPFYWRHLAVTPPEKFTAVMYTKSKTVISSLSSSSPSSSALYRLISNICKSTFLFRIIVLCHYSNGSIPRDVHWPVPSHIAVIVKTVTSIDSRFYPYEEIETDAVLGLDDDTMLTTDEVDFAFHAWKNFPDRLVGYPPRTHYWDDSRLQWSYVSKVTNDYSMVLPSAAFYHRYYGYMYTHVLAESLHSIVTELQNGEDILMNFLVSHATGRPPIKVGQRRQYKESMVTTVPSDLAGAKTPEWLSLQHFRQRQHCMNVFVAAFGYMPLVRSSMRLDPLLFKDPVSIVRKKYRQIEHV
ncbi:Exostosin-1a [Lamellibrachia satsuma]|nr:Exostosin-1a [Lamellibrachia satsuma]